MKARAKLIGGNYTELAMKIKAVNDKITASPVDSNWSEIEYIDLAYDFADALVGNNGYYTLPRGSGSPDDHLCRFVQRRDCELDTSDFQMAMFGFIKNGAGWCAIVTGYTYDYHVIIGKKASSYYMYPRFYLNGEAPYEPISVEFRLLSGENADYSGIARAYREYMLAERGCKPISERLCNELEYAKDSLYVRIRLAWKPVPSPVEEQTDENEPQIHVAMTFNQVGALMECCKAAGVEKAEFCLVGWNKSGHDGRYPQLFPVEPMLGGEEGLRALILKAQSLGYGITCHTNTTDSYSIADNYSPEITRKNADGTIASHASTWGGGRAKWVCPEKGLEIAKTELPKVAALGFHGLHYIDVISTISCQPCCDPKHPETRRDCADKFRETAKLSKELFGGFASEGGCDHTLPYLDYGLYISFYDTETKTTPPLFDASIPLWQIVYHGIVLSNPYTSTVNSPIKSCRHQLEVIERGGRPTVYIYSKFLTNGSNWMGNDDIICTTPADTDRTVKILADLYREFKPLAYLQTEFINHHEICSGVAHTTYSNGTVVTVDYNTGKYYIK